MKYVTWVIVALAALLLAAFAIHNHQPVTLDLWPLPLGEVRIALFVLVLLAAFLGFLIGGVVAWFGGGATRRAARLRGRALAETRRQLDDVRRDASARVKLPAPAARG